MTVTDVRFPHPAESASPVSADSVDSNVGHGHVFTRPDGHRARCGGPTLCRECSRDAAVQAAVQERQAAAIGRLRRIQELLNAGLPSCAVILDHLAAALEVLDPVEDEVVPPAKNLAVHSRACGIREHGHGPACHPNCPTCGGRPL